MPVQARREATMSPERPHLPCAGHGGPVYFRQQVLATVPRSGFAPGPRPVSTW
jgi:hypothetical protein